MIDINRAKEIAEEYNKESGDILDYCDEYEKAYVFESSSWEGKIGPQPIVVMKDTGEVNVWPAVLWMFDDYLDEDN